MGAQARNTGCAKDCAAPSALPHPFLISSSRGFYVNSALLRLLQLLNFSGLISIEAKLPAVDSGLSIGHRSGNSGIQELH